MTATADVDRSPTAWGAKYDKGGVKYDGGKLRFDLIPVHAMEQIARVFTVGAEKYADRNWQKGIVYSRLIAAQERHMQKYKGGENIDAETGCHHQASVAWYSIVLMEFDNYLPEMDDRVKMRQYGPLEKALAKAMEKANNELAMDHLTKLGDAAAKSLQNGWTTLDEEKQIATWFPGDRPEPAWVGSGLPGTNPQDLR